MVTEDYVSFETAKLLKEKGFDENCTKVYINKELRDVITKESIKECTHCFNHYLYPSDATAPTLQMAMKWLREEHKIGILPRQYHIYKENGVYDEFGYGVEIIKLGTDIPLNPNEGKISDKDRYFISTSYEQSCEAAIKYCLTTLI